MNLETIFAPLTSDERIAQSSPAFTDWKPMVPVPEDEPEPDFHHSKYGKPSQVWTYHDAAGKVVAHVARFETASGKVVLPTTFGELQGQRGWHWKGLPAPRPLYHLGELVKRPDAPVLVVEGEKTADAALKLFPDYVCVTSSGGSNAANNSDWGPLQGRWVIVWPDHDEPGRKYAEWVSKLATEAEAASVQVVQVPESFPSKWDLADQIPEEWDVGRLRGLIAKAHERAKPPSNAIVLVDLHKFLKEEFPPRKTLLDPILCEQSLSMIHAWRGVGKTHVALGIGYAIASGGSFLKWHAEKPRKVLYLDGEMPAVTLQDRLAAIIKSSTREAPDGYFHIVTPDKQPGAMPDLATSEGQAALDERIGDDMALIIVDNLSCLVRHAGRENDAESWLAVQDWALRHRARGRSILFIHHSGKSGTQRGTSKKEDILDTVISLKPPADYNPADGAVFEVHFEKARGIQGKDVEPFEVALRTDEQGAQTWIMKDVEGRTLERVVELNKLGMNQREIAEELGVNKSTVCRALKNAQAQGLIDSEKKRK